MNYSKLFYWLCVADNAKTMFITLLTIFSIISFISTVFYFIYSYTVDAQEQTEEDKKSQKVCRKWIWWSYPFTILFWCLYIFTPSKKDSLLIVAGGQTLNFLTQDSSARQIPHELSSFILIELRNMAQDAKVELGINKSKNEILEKAKKLSTSELLERIKTDSTLKNILLNN